MPDGIAALRNLGVELTPADGMPFRGIRFVGEGVAAEASFPHEHGLGVRRTRLHQALTERAANAGVVTCWQRPVEGLDASGVLIGGQVVRCRWIVGADGFHSRVRTWAGLRPNWSGVRRMGIRQHFRVQPWTDFVEVHWHEHCQAYITPVAPHEVCVALIGGQSPVRLSELPTLFPALAGRLRLAEPIGSERGAISMSTRLSAVTRGRIALVGDASGSIDGIAGEGLALAFRQAAHLGAALALGHLRSYEMLHRRIGRAPRQMARLLLLMGGSSGVRRRALGALAARPATFSKLLAVHIGALPPWEASRDILAFAFGLLATRAPMRQSP
jgi:2-polyprenyl-6-methoxyphenol hydroxylase-like FAD-dependent oxidoreductase